jgi:gamma-glutamylcyclotransferase (GGCT)/AIG2-like uncharacterized protein YtfP
MDRSDLPVDKQRLLYFAYGSNMNDKQMAKRCPGAELVGTARVDGLRFAIIGHGVATMISEPLSRVFGAVWNITDDHLRELDVREAVAAGVYRRVTHEVEMPGGMTSVWTYIAASTTFAAPRTGYLETVCEGAKWLGLDDDYAAELASWGAR